MKIYTKTGDGGETGLLGASRVSKADLRIECLGTIDELNAQVGYLRTLLPADLADDLSEESRLLLAVQRHLFEMGAAVADLRSPPTVLQLDGAVTQLEASIDRMTDRLAPLTSFILPGGTPSGAVAHVTRAVCRRAERGLVGLIQRSEEELDGQPSGSAEAIAGASNQGSAADRVAAESRSDRARTVAWENLRATQIYLNRLSDWLFTLARWLNQVQGTSEAPWPG